MKESLVLTHLHIDHIQAVSKIKKISGGHAKTGNRSKRVCVTNPVVTSPLLSSIVFSSIVSSTLAVLKEDSGRWQILSLANLS